MRALPFFVAVLALLLALWPGSYGHAADMGGPRMVASPQTAEGCAPSVAHHGKTERHDTGDRGKIACCLGAVCGVAGLPTTSMPPTPLSSGARVLPSADTFLTGRDVAPPFDPPRAFV